MFTYHYSQPPEYRFSLDSIHLARYVAENFVTKIDLASFKVLDLCAGCGVLGFELTWHLPQIRQIDFVEVQEIYTPYFYENVVKVNRSELKLNWYVENYDALLEKNWENRYALIISNPPYFQPNQGIHSPSEFKNRCRFFLDSTFENYIFALAKTLAPRGCAYFYCVH